MKYPRGQTAKPSHALASRPPKSKGGVSNDFAPDKPRSAIMPPPTGETQEPRGKALSKGPKSKRVPSLAKALEKYER